MDAVELGRLKQQNSRWLERDIAERRTVLRALPEIVVLNNTDICNLRCVMCPRHLAQRRYRLDHDEISRVAAELFPTAWKVNLTQAGGEPLGEGFDLIIECAKRYAAFVDITTNGLLLTPDVFREVQPVLDHLNVSVDCIVPEIYEQIRVGRSFAKLQKNLLAMREERAAHPDSILLSLSAVVMRSTLPHLPQLVEFAADVGADGVILQRLRHQIKPTPEEEPSAFFAPEKVEGFLREAEDRARRIGLCLFESDLGRPNVVTRIPRDKKPKPAEGRGMCSFLVQSFAVM